MLKTLEKINSESRFVNPYWEYKVDKYVMPSGRTGEYHYVNSRGATIIIPKLENDKYLLINQYRYLNQRTSIEFPGGGIKINKTPIDNAHEELKEETGYSSDKLIQIGEYNPYNGVTNENCYVFLADGLSVSKSNPEESEEFELMQLSEFEINEKIKSGEIWDGMTLAAWSVYIVNKEE